MSHGLDRHYIEIRVRAIVNKLPSPNLKPVDGEEKLRTEIRVQAVVAQALMSDNRIDACELDVVAELGDQINTQLCMCGCGTRFAVALPKLQEVTDMKFR